MQGLRQDSNYNPLKIKKAVFVGKYIDSVSEKKMVFISSLGKRQIKQINNGIFVAEGKKLRAWWHGQFQKVSGRKSARFLSFQPNSLLLSFHTLCPLLVILILLVWGNWLENSNWGKLTGRSEVVNTAFCPVIGLIGV